jgi:hypothetical protein
MEVVCSSEISLTADIATQCNKTEDHNLITSGSFGTQHQHQIQDQMQVSNMVVY